MLQSPLCAGLPPGRAGHKTKATLTSVSVLLNARLSGGSESRSVGGDTQRTPVGAHRRRGCRSVSGRDCQWQRRSEPEADSKHSQGPGPRFSGIFPSGLRYMPRLASALARWLSLTAAPAGRAAGGRRLLPHWQANSKVVSERVTTSHLSWSLADWRRCQLQRPRHSVHAVAGPAPDGTKHAHGPRRSALSVSSLPPWPLYESLSPWRLLESSHWSSWLLPTWTGLYCTEQRLGSRPRLCPARRKQLNAAHRMVSLRCC